MAQQSPNWLKYADYSGGFIEDGFPFREGFPQNRDDKTYELILTTGSKCVAVVDYSRQYMAEGIEWHVLESTESFWREGNVKEQIVAAWRELQ